MIEEKEKILNHFHEVIDIFCEAPESQVNPSIVKRAACLKETKSFSLIIEALNNIINDCALFGLCSDFVLERLETILEAVCIAEEKFDDEAS